MRPSRGASGREWGQPDRIAECTDDTPILNGRDAAGKQAAAMLALFTLATDLQRADVALLALAFAGSAS